MIWVTNSGTKAILRFDGIELWLQARYLRLIVVSSRILVVSAQIEYNLEGRARLAGMCHTPCRWCMTRRVMRIGKAQSVDAEVPE
jgi:hypothetical protein